MPRLNVLIAYDIRDDRRRADVAKILESYGLRVQLSVFTCQLRPTQVERLRAALAEAINQQEDSIALVFLCERCVRQVQWLGRGHCQEPWAASETIV